MIGSRALGAPIRAQVDKKDKNASAKRWDWVRRGAPLLVEIGPREVEANAVSVLRRDALYEGEKVKPGNTTADEFANTAASRLEDIQSAMHGRAKSFMDNHIEAGITEFGALGEFFGEAPVDEDGPSEGPLRWARVPWCKPAGAALEAVEAKLDPLKLTIRNAPLDQNGVSGACIFTGEEAVEEILIARAY